MFSVIVYRTNSILSVIVDRRQVRMNEVFLAVYNKDGMKKGGEGN